MDNQLDDLMDQVLDGTLTDDQRQQLDRELQRPESRARGRRYYRIHQLLPLLVREAEGDRFAQAVRTELAGNATGTGTGQFVQRHRRRRRKQVAGSRWSWLGWGTALAALLVLGILALRHGSESQVSQSDIPPDTAVVQAVQSVPEGVSVVGTPLTRLDDGAWFLSQGQSELTVQPQAMGLRVRTPQVETIVHGTVFTLVAQPESSQVSVAHGRVEVIAQGDRVFLESGATITADASGLLRCVAAQWLPGAQPGWHGQAVTGGLRSANNPSDAGSGLVQTPKLPLDQSPILNNRQQLRVRYTAASDQPQTVAAMIVGRPAKALGQAWLCERMIEPGSGEAVFPLSDFMPRDAIKEPLAGQRVEMAGVICWGGGIDGVIVHEIQLVEDFR